MREKNHKVSLVLAGLPLLGVLLAACGPQQVAIAANMSEFEYQPPNWEVPANAQVTLTLTNDGKVVHTWTLMEAGYTVTPPFTSRRQPARLAGFPGGCRPGANFHFLGSIRAGHV